MTQRSITSGALTGAQVGDVLALAEAARAADGVAPLSEPTLLHLRYGGREPGRDLVLGLDGEIVGYAYTGPPGAPEADLSGELVIDPARRRQGLGLALLRAVIAEADGHAVRMSSAWGPASRGRARRVGGIRALPRPVADAPVPAGSARRARLPAGKHAAHVRAGPR